MQNSTTETQSASQPPHRVQEASDIYAGIHSVSENLRQSAEQLISSFQSESEAPSSSPTQASSSPQSSPQSSIEPKYVKAIGLVGLLAVAGTVGYLLGRNQSRSRKSGLAPGFSTDPS